MGKPDTFERGGTGRCRRCAARRSPGDSKATAGKPNVVPSNEASAPPRECPTSHTLAFGYMSVRFLTRFLKRWVSRAQTRKRLGQDLNTYHSDRKKQAILDKCFGQTMVVAGPVSGVAIAHGREDP